MNDILFIHPNSSKIIYQELSEDFSAIEPPIWLAMLANRERKLGYEVEILDCEALGLANEDVVIIKHFQTIVISTYGQQPSASAQNMEGATRLATILRENGYSGQIGIFGIYSSALPDKTLKDHPEIDFIYPTPPIEDLDGMAWDLLPMDRYRTSLWHSYSNNCQRKPFAALYTSLNCPFACSFCCINATFGKPGFKYWKPELMINEFDRLARRGIKNIKIADEMFVMKPDHFMKLCKLIIERGYKFNIWCYARVDITKPEYLPTLKKAGVNWLALGIESGNKGVRKNVIKGRFEDIDIRRVVSDIRSHGINVIGNYIFGLPDDTMETMGETLSLAKEMNTEEANFYSCMAYPGSKLYDDAVLRGIKLPDTYAGYSQHSYECQPLPTKTLTAAQVLAFRDKAWMEYHTDPAFLRLLLDKFGNMAVDETIRSTQIILKRKICEGK